MNKKENKMIRITKFCNEHNFSVKKFINIFIEQGVLNKDELNTFSVNSKYKNIGKQEKDVDGNFFLLINEKEVLRYISEKKLKNTLYLKDDEKKFSQLTDISSKKDRFLKLKSKTLIFLDFEAKNQEYSECGIIIAKNGKVLTKKYLIDENICDNEKIEKIVKSNELNGVKTIKNQKEKLDVVLKKYIKENSIIVSHNSNSERKILQKLNIDVTNIEFICTEKFSEGFINFISIDNKIKSPNLLELANFFGIKLNLSLIHTAFYDSYICYEIFKKYNEMLLLNNMKDFPINFNIKQKCIKLSTRKEKLEKKKIRKSYIENYMSNIS